MKRIDGFSLLETLIAVTVLTVGIGALAYLVVRATLANRSARETTVLTLLAEQKLEQLKALAWSIDPAGAPVSDTESDTSVVPATSSGGTGLDASPTDSLAERVEGYCDFLDAYSHPMGGGVEAPEHARYERRWSIVPLASDADTLVLQVVVFPLGAQPVNTRRGPSIVRLLGLKARKRGV